MRKVYILCLLAGWLAFSVYSLTLAPSITWRHGGVDSGDLAAAVAAGGVPHPPGYPTYLVLGEIFKQLPVGDIAYRLNLLSAVCAALTVTVTGLFIYRTLSNHFLLPQPGQTRPGLHLFCALSASLLLAFSGLFWLQAVIAEVYMLNLLFVAGLLYGGALVKPANERWLVPGLFGWIGLGLGNHFSVVLVAPILLVQLCRTNWSRRLIIYGVLAFLLGLSIYAVIPLRAASGPPVNWGMASGWSGFVWLISAELYRPFIFQVPWPLVPVRIGAELSLLAETFMGWGLPVGLIGFYHLARANRGLAYGSLASFLLISIYAVGYNTTDSYVYLLPACLLFAWWIGWGFDRLGHNLEKFGFSRHYRLAGFCLLLLPGLSLWLNFAAQNLSQEDEAFLYGQRVLETVAPGAVIVADNDLHTFSLWYSRYGLNMRPDVAVINSNLLPYAWYRESLAQHHPELGLHDALNRPITTLPVFLKRNLARSPIYLLTFQAIELEGYRLESQNEQRHLTRVTVR